MFPNLTFHEPVQMIQAGQYWYLIERAGRVWRFPDDPQVAAPDLVLDISDVVTTRNDDGLVGVALRSDFAATGDLYVSYTRAGVTSLLQSLITRFHSADGGRTFARDSESVLIRIDQSIDYHVNADLQFGPDGYLYIGFGDGAAIGTNDSPARDPGLLAGKILRIDVTGPAPYSIPPDNPFLNSGAPEVFAYGLRNPWRFTFDRDTGDLWAGDVGWSSWEEIDRIVAGGYYGWNTYEGTECIVPERCGEAYREPEVIMGHDRSRAIAAGYVYRGAALPGLAGRMVFGDFVTGYIWSFDPAERTPEVLANSGLQVVSFAQDRAGELYVVDFGGTLWRIDPSDGTPGQEGLPSVLSALGCFEDDGTPKPGLIPYDLEWSFYSDGASKRRWFALPDDKTIDVSANELALPVGAMIIKEFSLGTQRVETRVLAHQDETNWVGYSYVWRQDGTDADLVRDFEGSRVVQWGDQSWYYPARPECLGCHNAAVGRAIGFKALQLDRDFEYAAGHVANQLATYDHIGLFENGPPTSSGPKLPSRTDRQISTAERARAWLHANCANCHRPDSNLVHDLDLRFATPLADIGICDVPPNHGDLGITDARLIAPGDPSRSVLLARVRSLDVNKMPPRSGFTYDPDGAALLEDWISGLTSCR